jgi:hypothetical protein
MTNNTNNKLTPILNMQDSTEQTKTKRTILTNNNITSDKTDSFLSPGQGLQVERLAGRRVGSSIPMNGSFPSSCGLGTEMKQGTGISVTQSE